MWKWHGWLDTLEDGNVASHAKSEKRPGSIKAEAHGVRKSWWTQMWRRNDVDNTEPDDIEQGLQAPAAKYEMSGALLEAADESPRSFLYPLKRGSAASAATSNSRPDIGSAQTAQNTDLGPETVVQPRPRYRSIDLSNLVAPRGSEETHSPNASTCFPPRRANTRSVEQTSADGEQDIEADKLESFIPPGYLMAPDARSDTFPRRRRCCDGPRGSSADSTFVAKLDRALGTWDGPMRLEPSCDLGRRRSGIAGRQGSPAMGWVTLTDVAGQSRRQAGSGQHSSGEIQPTEVVGFDGSKPIFSRGWRTEASYAAEQDRLRRQRLARKRWYIDHRVRSERERGRKLRSDRVAKCGRRALKAKPLIDQNLVKPVHRLPHSMVKSVSRDGVPIVRRLSTSERHFLTEMHWKLTGLDHISPLASTADESVEE
ncbi:MAG: hypothetical protein M1825_004307 [Sarcosagium campestre]|nr:MAG: hypothetical protein M1825_004307 [Sarcosagium campestre]